MDKFFKFLVLTSLVLIPLSALPPSGRSFPSMYSDRYEDNRGVYGDRQRANSYYYPTYSSGYPYYSDPYYRGGYYGNPSPYMPRDAFPDATKADNLFDRLSK